VLLVPESLIDDCRCVEGPCLNMGLSGGSLLSLFVIGDNGRDILYEEKRLREKSRA
jgi:hypothetical protein